MGDVIAEIHSEGWNLPKLLPRPHYVGTRPYLTTSGLDLTRLAIIHGKSRFVIGV